MTLLTLIWKTTVAESTDGPIALALAGAQPLSQPRHNSLLAIVAGLCDWLKLPTFILRGTLEQTVNNNVIFTV